jgi:hypothetical protein
MFSDGSFSFNGNENPFLHYIFGIDMASGYNSNSIDYMLQQDDIDYQYKINELRQEIEKALATRNEDLFMALSNKYNMMLAEM